MDERGGTEGMQRDSNEERGFKAKTVLGEIKPGRDDLQLCIKVSFWHHLSSKNDLN